LHGSAIPSPPNPVRAVGAVEPTRPLQVLGTHVHHEQAQAAALARNKRVGGVYSSSSETAPLAIIARI
jgi:hypothetical protein